MAHQLNTDYLRRKLLNPQRQVSFLCSILLAFQPSPLAAAPQNSELFILLRHQHFAVSLLSLFDPCRRNIQDTAYQGGSCLLISTCHIKVIGESLVNNSRAPGGASADHLAPRLPSSLPSPSEPDENYPYSQHTTLLYTKIQ